LFAQNVYESTKAARTGVNHDLGSVDGDRCYRTETCGASSLAGTAQVGDETDEGEIQR
jgi:hypothetical protein